MEGFRQYFYGLTAASVLCGILIAMFPGKGTGAKLLKLTTGILLTLVALRPLTRLDFRQVTQVWTTQSLNQSGPAAEGEAMAQNAIAEGIKARCEAYILDKASLLGLDLTVRIILSEDSIPVPVAVELEGKASPYGKTALQSTIESDLGIPKEAQQWTQ